MQRIAKHLRIGRRWITIGWQLFRRNPWLLGGMGFTIAVLISALALIPLLGSLLIALLAPILLASAYLAINSVYKQKISLPAALRVPALKQSPRHLVDVLRDEARIFPTAVACVYCTAGALLINLLVHLLAGDAWVATWSSLEWVSQLGVFAAALLGLVLYAVLAASLIYALPLTFLLNEPLVPSLLRSLKASRHFALALLVLLGLLLAPFLLLGTVVSYISPWAGYPIWLVTGTVVLPVAAAGLYGSYHDIFASQRARRRMETCDDDVTDRNLTLTPARR
ncbi:MAG: hypothetical protein ACYC7B_12460 [Burkholderiales bacterium]